MTDLASLIAPERIVLDSAVATRLEAIDAVGALLASHPAVPPSYVVAMQEREAVVSTYLGAGVAVPHATASADDDGGLADDVLAVLRFPAGVEWDGERAFVAIGVAARLRSHTAILAALARVLMDPDRAAALREAGDAAQVRAVLATSPSSTAVPGGSAAD